jgi:hypothetical protein
MHGILPRSADGLIFVRCSRIKSEDMGGLQRLSVGRNGDMLVETAVERPAVGRGTHGESAFESAAEVKLATRRRKRAPTRKLFHHNFRKNPDMIHSNPWGAKLRT